MPERDKQAQGGKRRRLRRHMTGRPSDYSEEIASVICERLADGLSLREICLADDMPARSTVFLWLSRHHSFSDQYARAREAQADALVEECLQIADDGSNDWMARTGKDGDPGWQLNGENVQRSRLRCDQRKWWAGKIAPKKYGDKIDLTATVSQFDGLTPEQRAALDAACEILLLSRATVIEGEVRTPALIESPKEPPDSESVTR